MALDYVDTEDNAEELPESQGFAAEAQQMPAAERLNAIIGIPNIAALLEEDQLNRIAAQVIEEYELDDKSREEWKEVTSDAMDLAMLVVTAKTYPFENAANVKYPLLTTAALQFSARAYPAIVPGDRIVKCRVNGRDPMGQKAARADRVSEYESWQLTDQMPEWEDDTDRLLVTLPITGCVFRKRYWDPALGRQVSRLITADRLVVNYRARSLAEAPRVTEEMTLYPYEIQERIRDERFVDFDYSKLSPANDEDKSKDSGSAEDKDAPHLFLEQHRLLDLDEDGYPEPYIVTVHKSASKVCRIVANFTPESARISADQQRVIAIRKRDYYVKYDFLPSPDGGFYGLGFGWLLKTTNEAINTTLNEMLDAGHLANIQGGFVSSALGLREKEIRLKMGQFKVLPTTAPINQAVMPISYPGPSATLFQLLGLLVEMGKEVASIKDVLSGETRQNMQPTTVLALIEQGMQFFTAIYKRVHRALKAELALHAELNRENLTPEEYNKYFDGEEMFDPQADFEGASEDISPASDPSVSSRMQKLGKAEFVLNAAKDNPLINQEEALRRYLEAADIEDLDKLIQPPPPPDPLMVLLGELEAQDTMAGITEKLTKAIKNIADAEAAEEGPQLEQYRLFLEALGMEMTADEQGGQGGLPGMEGTPDDQMGQLPAQGAL